MAVSDATNSLDGLLRLKKPGGCEGLSSGAKLSARFGLTPVSSRVELHAMKVSFGLLFPLFLGVELNEGWPTSAVISTFWLS